VMGVAEPGHRSLHLRDQSGEPDIPHLISVIIPRRHSLDQMPPQIRSRAQPPSANCHSFHSQPNRPHRPPPSPPVLTQECEYPHISPHSSSLRTNPREFHVSLKTSCLNASLLLNTRSAQFTRLPCRSTNHTLNIPHRPPPPHLPPSLNRRLRRFPWLLLVEVGSR
jgi:hypothetical protein